MGEKMGSILVDEINQLYLFGDLARSLCVLPLLRRRLTLVERRLPPSAGPYICGRQSGASPAVSLPSSSNGSKNPASVSVPT
ncbi:hypothetical protein PI124_g21271 [Phytophthora idaei]|nr:hypothetical protein PI125_g23083 [Phytophthora idaei]KAG3233654.1 hypothetical protein PI124_g21271 [Phytophthora idaei]